MLKVFVMPAYERDFDMVLSESSILVCMPAFDETEVYES